MLKIIKQISILILLVLILIFPYFVFGAEGYKGPTIKSGLEGLGTASGYSTNVNQTTVSAIAGTAVSAFLSVLGVIFIALMLYGGYIWMMARGSEEEVTRAKDIIKAAVIGLIIVVASYAISFFIFDRITRQTLTPSGSGVVPVEPGPCGEGKELRGGDCQDILDLE
ncbi:MAG: pilin [Patescibacteria group bacterium]